MKRAHPVLFLFALALLVSCGSTSRGATYGRVDDLVTEGHYREALQVAADYATRRPRDAAAGDLHRQATVAFLLAEGRDLTFDGRDDEALERFDKALELSPDQAIVQGWNEKIHKKLANKWGLIARDLHLADNLEGAVEAYEKALAYHADHEQSRQGLARALIQLNHRDGLSTEYYNDGLRALQDYRLQLSRKRFEYSTKYRPEDEKTQRRITEVDRMLATERLAYARQLEERGLHAAAYNEYRFALLLDPEDREAVGGRERMRIEVEATKLAERAEMMVRRKEFDQARELLAQGLEVTVTQKERFEDLLADIDDSRIRAKYEEAIDLEYDFQYEDAIAMYAELLRERQYFEDTRARMSTLQEYVERAKELYDQAARLPPGEQRVQLFRQIEIFWPEYRDVREQLEGLNAGVK